MCCVGILQNMTSDVHKLIDRYVNKGYALFRLYSWPTWCKKVKVCNTKKLHTCHHNHKCNREDLPTIFTFTCSMSHHTLVSMCGVMNIVIESIISLY